MKAYNFALLYLCFVASVLGGYFTHVVVSLMAKQWLFMIVGTLLAPVGIVHGWAIWLGFDGF